MAAARAWAAGTLVTSPTLSDTGADDALSDAMAWGATPEELAGLLQHLGAQAVGGVRVWPANVEAVRIWLMVCTQWRTGLTVANGRLKTLWLGLDYAGVRAKLAIRRVGLGPDRLAALELMEAAAANALNGVGQP